ncbi:integrase [Paraburkholderia phytofirmans]|uniref:Integrase n=1 Tax=Paraburkholderia phytofirmans TaxID=261302 RepID=A0ABW9BL70_9BURK
MLNTAVELARKQVSDAVAYRIAGQLQLIAEFMNSKGFISLRQTWVHGMKRPRELGSRISKEALDARQEKLPSAAVLRALGGIFQEAVQPADVAVSSYLAVMLCAPERINEVLRLARNCLVEGDGRFDGKLGLRWAGSKGAKDTTKWLPTQMVPVARQAISNLLKVTAPAKNIAAWYTDNPNTLYLHDGAAHLRGQEVLTAAEVALILWGDEGATNQANTWARETAALPKVQLASRKAGYRFEDVERAVLGMLPETFPFVPGAPELLCKDAMAIIRTNEMHAQKATYLCMITCVDYSSITNPLGAREGRSSIFERFNYTEDDGSPIELRSHALRHYLNMLAQLGGLSNAEIAIFSGRKDVRQNRAYDHMSSDEAQAPISQALKAGFTAGLIPAATRDLITRSEFKGFGVVAAHTTEYGWCMHNFASEPCQMYRDCINCEEQECVKGDAHKEANLRLLKEETEFLLNEAREALNDEEYGADVWVAHQSKTLERVNALLSIMDNPSVQPGSRIRLNLENAALITADSTQPIYFLKAEEQKLLP